MGCLDCVLNKIANQKYPCYIAGDINIDVTKCNLNKQTAEYVNMLLSNNCVPTIILPTRIISYSATLIDHMYYYEGIKSNSCMIIESGNFLSDLSDYLFNYTMLLNTCNTNNTVRPLVRIMSQKNKDKFINILSSSNWDTIFSLNDVNLAYNIFFKTITDAYELSFPLTRLSRKRKRKSNRTKNALFTKWLTTRLLSDGQAYKHYRKIFKKVTTEAETLYFNSRFDRHANSIKQLWTNLNTVCSFNNSKSKHQTISKLRLDNDKYVTTSEGISNGLNNFFSTVDDN